jgi:phosphoribosylaminoimidazolecarboxamide formyltransferase / IMP cyclohydrolase
MSTKLIKSALISVYYKDGLEPIIRELHRHGVTLYSTGGTQDFIEKLGLPVTAVETLTGYPSILDGRVKTLHPKVFGGILARREENHLAQLTEYAIPEIDLVIVDLYPFEETLANTADEALIIEKIDIGGISLIRAAAKNYRDVAIVASREEYPIFLEMLQAGQGGTTLENRRELARKAFLTSSHYDTAIFNYFNREAQEQVFQHSLLVRDELRYGENPHQNAVFHGNFEQMFEKLAGKAISFNNLVDIDAAVGLMNEFLSDGPTFAVLKHTNCCGVATRPTVLEAWQTALSSDNLSAFGGVLITNSTVDLPTAQAIDEIFYEVLIAPNFSPEAQELLSKKKNRILLQIKHFNLADRNFRSLLNGVIEQDSDKKIETQEELELVSKKAPTASEIDDLLFANKCVKHLKSNAIALAKNKQLIGMGCGQTSRVDSMRHAIEKAQRFSFDISGAVMASDAFFPFPDTVQLAHEAGVTAVIQPGGSIRDQDSVDYCDAHGVAMVKTGIRHFKH